MDYKRRNNVMTLELIVAFPMQIAGVIVVAIIYETLATVGIYLDIFGDKTAVLGGMLFGLPTGSLVGVFLIDRLKCKSRLWNIKGIILALAAAYIGIIGVIFFMDILGGPAVFLSPIVVPIMTVLGYNLFLKFPIPES